MKRYHIGMPNLFQYSNFSLDIFPAHSTTAGLCSPFLDEFCCKLQAGTFLAAFFHYGKLPTEKQRDDEVSVQDNSELRVACLLWWGKSAFNSGWPKYITASYAIYNCTWRKPRGGRKRN